MTDYITSISSYGRAIRNWWVFIVLGLLFIAMGIVVFRHPAATYATLAVFFGILILISGIVQIFIGAYAPRNSGRGWMIAAGAVETVLGLILTFNIAVSGTILPLFLGFWLMFRGLTMIGFASDLRGAGIKGTGWTIFWGIALMLCALVILVFPGAGAGLIITWLGVSFPVAGTGMIFFGLYLRGQRKNLS